MVSTNAAIALGLLLSASLLPASAQTKAVGKQNPLVAAQLRVAFARVDSDKDGFLDAAELARTFRGPKAKGAPPTLEFDDMGNPKTGTGFDRKYADQVYLYALDKDFDGRISWAEFDEYGEAYAAALQGKQLTQPRQQALYTQAQRNYNTVRTRGSSYSRSYGNRNSYYRPVRRPQVRVTNTAQRIQAQQIRLVQEQQRRMIQMQQQAQRMQMERMRAIYTRELAAAHRAVKTPPRRR